MTADSNRCCCQRVWEHLDRTLDIEMIRLRKFQSYGRFTLCLNFYSRHQQSVDHIFR